jgi:cytochrome b561
VRGIAVCGLWLCCWGLAYGQGEPVQGMVWTGKMNGPPADYVRVARHPGWSEAGVRGGVTDSLLRSAPDSLPANMPLINRIFWGRKGLVRLAGLAPSSRRAELQLRRQMLQVHQALGFVLLGVTTAQVVTGQLMYSNPGRYYEELRPLHRALGYGSFVLYLGTGSLSLLAPPARRYQSGLYPIKVHRYLAYVHMPGMLLQPWLGRAMARARDPDTYRRLRTLHRWTGWITYGALVTAFGVTLLEF